MPEQQNRYSFDSKDRMVWFWSKPYRSQLRDRDLNKIRADLPVAKELDVNILYDYLDVVHRNVFWYLVNRKKQEKLYYLYMALTLALAALIPYACFKIAFLAKEAGVTSGVVTAQLTTILTGGIAFHRVITSWLFRRNTALEFWRAGSAIKKLHMGLMERWTKPGAPTDPGLLKADLAVTAKKARAVINIETEAHFSAFSGISVDLGKLLTSSAATSKLLLDDFGGRIIDEIKEIQKRNDQRAEEAREEHLKLVELRAEVKTLGRQLTRLSTQRELISDREKMGELTVAIEATRARLTEKEILAAKTEAKYMALSSATKRAA